MSTTVFFAMVIFETAVIGGVFILYPRFARRGLLFGVYVGEDAGVGPDARAITVAWYRAMAVWLVAAAALEFLLGTVAPKPALIAFFPFVLLAGVLGLYVRAYRQAQQFAVPAPARGVAFVQTVPEASLALPIAALVAGLLAGVISIVYSAVMFPQLPDRIPTHFGISGAPDAWHARTFWSVMIGPLMTLVLGAGLGGAAVFTARAKRAVRYRPRTSGSSAPAAERETAISLQAQLRFRRAVTRLISTVGLLVALGMTSLNVSTIEVALGRARGLSWLVMVPMLLVLVIGIAGSLYIGLRYGQGGSRLEREVAAAPLTNGLADNRFWVLGAFYVNHDDPSFFVEDRFGLGYTLNLGNRKAVLALGGFIAAIIALVVVAIVFV